MARAARNMGKREQPSGRRKPAPRAIGRDAWERIFGAAANGETGLRPIARAARVHTSTVKRAMEVGWPERGLPPVSEALALRRAAGRALADALPEVKFDADGATPCPESLARAALPSALYQVAEESRTLEFLRQMGVKLAQTTSMLAEGSGGVARVTLARLAKQVEDDELSPVEAIRALKSIADTGRVAVDMIGELMKLHRLVLGQPGDIIGQPVFATTEEALAVLDRGTRMAARARALGLVSLPGGREGDINDQGGP